MFRRKPNRRSVHRGRIWRDPDFGWRYACHDCDWGAGSAADAKTAFPWLILNANWHATGYLPTR